MHPVSSFTVFSYDFLITHPGTMHPRILCKSYYLLGLHTPFLIMQPCDCLFGTMHPPYRYFLCDPVLLTLPRTFYKITQSHPSLNLRHYITMFLIPLGNMHLPAKQYTTPSYLSYTRYESSSSLPVLCIIPLSIPYLNYLISLTLSTMKPPRLPCLPLILYLGSKTFKILFTYHIEQ